MLDAVRVLGRWISKSLLARLSARSEGPQAPTRQTLLKEFCRLTHWVDRKGRPCLSSANIGIQRLEAAGEVKFPPPAPRKARSQPRQLPDDGLPLPPVPKLPRSAEMIKDLHLYLIADERDPQHPLWNRLIGREHPLGRAPLVGAQLRYLIMAGEEVIGAFGFGPASFYLSCRDAWIGWDAQAREQNRSRVLGLSRFLLRPGVRCANLASSCYALVLRRVRADWQQRYGLTPLLIETYVDRSTQTGRSLVAANWLRIGSTQGRGRTSPNRQTCPKSQKDVWVWQWDPQARRQLQQRSLPPIVGRSVFADDVQAPWIDEELDGLDLGHAKLDQRFAAMLEARWLHPDRSFYASFTNKYEGVGAYDFLANRREGLNFAALLEPHQNSTRRRMAAEKVVLMAQDTSIVSYNTLVKTTGLGPIGNEDKSGRGFFLHSLQAYRLDGIPLGCAWAEVWARPPQSDTTQRNQQSIDQKESGRWLEAYQAARAAAEQMPRTMIMVCGDRESDIIDLFDRATVAPPNLRFLVRAQHDRILSPKEKLWDHLAGQPVGGTMQVTVPRRTGQAKRTAVLELRWARVQIVPPRVGCKNSWGTLQVYALEAKEVNPPAGVEPIVWVLLTDWPIDSFKTACRLVCWYGLRWGIECWHQVLKDVCGVERRQMKSARALIRSLVLDMIVAWRILLLCRLGKSHPNLPASLMYSPDELAILQKLKEEAGWPDDFDPNSGPDPGTALPAPAPAPEALCSPVEELPPSPSTAPAAPAAITPAAPAAPTATPPAASAVPAATTPAAPAAPTVTAPAPGPAAPRAPASARARRLTLLQANMLVARLAGFWGRKCDGHPGPDVMGRGLMQLALLVEWEKINGRIPRGRPRGKQRSWWGGWIFAVRARPKIQTPMKSDMIASIANGALSSVAF